MRLDMCRLAAIACSITLCQDACIVVDRNPAYPREWAAMIPTPPGSCPDIAGTYRSGGEMHLESGVSCPAAGKANDTTGAWDCRLTLGDNLGVGGTATSVTLTQTASDSLVVGLIGEGGGPDKRVELQRGRDFECDGDSLFFADTRSLLGGPVVTAFGVLTLTGGVVHHSRAFARNTAGELVMTVRERGAAYHIVVGVTSSSSAHVRWRPVEPGATAGRDGE